jgi:hypothetical protein
LDLDQAEHVNSRQAGLAKRSVISAFSSVRPMNDVGCGGKLCIPTVCFDDCCTIVIPLAVAVNQPKFEVNEIYIGIIHLLRTKLNSQ